MSRHSVIAALVLAGAWTAPSLATAAPAWCNVEGAQKLAVSSLDDLYSEDDPRDALMTLVAATCYPDSDAKAQAKQIETTRQAWSKKLAMTDADWADAADWAQRPQVERNSPSIYATEKRAWTAFTPIDQYGAILNSTMGDSSKVTDAEYLVDALGDKLTETGRFAYISLCIQERSGPVRWAMCQPDIAALNLTKLATELRGDTQHNGYQRMTIRLAVFESGPKLAEHANRVKELKAKDPAYAKMFTLAEGAWKSWASVDASLVALMTNIDDARVTNSRKASEGCEAKTWDAWKRVVGGIPAKSFAALKGEDNWSFFSPAIALILNNPNGYLAGLALNQCGMLNKDTNYLVRELGENLGSWPGFRGPRGASHTTILTAGLELDDRDQRIEYPDLERPWLHRQTGSSGGGKGVVASMKTSGAKTTIEFKKEKVKQTRCTKGHYTNRVTQITSSGSIIYQYICTAEVNETIIVAPFPPATVNSRYVEALKVGMLVTVVEDVVAVAYKGETPVVVAGVGVK
jgi:hypothetical protein